MTVLPITNIINVTVSTTPQGLTAPNMNSVVIFSNDAYAGLNTYDIYVSASQVAENYGTTSKTALMADAIFAQVPNIRTGNGRLVIVPMIAAVSATTGDFTTANISANLAGLIAVDDGDLKVTVNGVDYDLTNIDLTSCTTFANIATVLQNKLSEVTFEATANGIKATSKKVGADSTVAFGAVSGGSGTDLSGSSYFNAGSGTATDGEDSEGETILEAIARTQDLVQYVGMTTTLLLEDDAIEAIADGVQAMDKTFHIGVSSTHDILGIIKTVSDQSNTKTRIYLHKDGLDEASYFAAGMLSKYHAVYLSGSNTAMTGQLKTVTTISSDLYITQNDFEAVKANGGDIYPSFGGLAKSFVSGANDFYDNVYMDIALKMYMEVAGFNYLAQTNTKVPQTEQGMDGLKAAYARVCDQFVRNGFIAPGSWTSSERFGDPEIFDENIETKGYYIYSLPIVEQDAAEREGRIAPLVQIAIKRAGAIHFSVVNVLVND